MVTSVKWLDRDLSPPAPFLCLCLSQKEFDLACSDLGVSSSAFLSSDFSDATTHLFEKKNGLVAIVCIRANDTNDPIEVASLLVHEAVHVWQAFLRNIGERNPGDEQEAYGIQIISQRLMLEFRRRVLEQLT